MVKTEVIVAAKGANQTKTDLESVGQGMDNMGTKAADVSAKFLLIKGAIGEAVGMVNQFIDGAVSVGQAAARSAALMDDEGVSADLLRGKFDELSQSQEGALSSQEDIANAFNKIAAEGRGLEGTMLIIENAMALTAVTGGDLATTGDTIEAVMSAMNLTIEDTTRITDVLLNTMKETGADAAVLGQSMLSMGQLFDSLGMSVEESAALIGVFKDVGQEGVTGLLSAFTQLTSETSVVSKKFEEMGVKVKDSNGELLSLPEVFQAVEKAGFTATDMLAGFGIRGSGAMVTAVNQLNTVLDVTQSNLDATGAAAEAAGTVFADESTDIVEAKNDFADMKTELAEGLMPVISGFMSVLSPMFELIGKYPAIIYAAVGAFVAYKIAMAASTIVTTAQTIATGIATVATLALNAALWASPFMWIVGVILLVVGGIILLIKNIDKVIGFFKKLGAAAKKYFGWVMDFYKAMGAGIKNVAGKVKDGVVGMIKKYAEFYKAIGEGLKNALGKVKNFLGDLWGTIKQGFKDAITNALNWGKELIENFIKGIKDKFADLGKGLKDMGGKIKDFIGFSLPKEGPLREVQVWGGHMAEEFIGGAQDTFSRRAGDVVSNFKTSTTSADNRVYRNQVNFNNYPLDLSDPMLIRDLRRSLGMEVV